VTGPEAKALDRSLRIHPWQQACAQTLFWGPIFFLFFSERFPVDRVLQLSGIYYIAVVLLEVPSGWFSDRVSRVKTLRIGNAAMAAAHALFALGGDEYTAFVAAQCMLALGYAFRSGTDTSFHFDTLSALGRAEDFGPREAWIHRNSYIAIGISAIIGGGIATLDLRLAYAAQSLFCLAALVLAFMMREPPRHEEGFAHAHFGHQLRLCFAYARQPFLAWIFAYVVLMTTTAHIPWEFAQPYVAAVFGEAIDAVERTPVATGALHAIIAWVGAVAAARSIWLRDRLGIGGSLLTVTLLQTGLIVAMALTVHPMVALLLVVRSVQPAVSDVVVSASILPRVPQGQRATYQSLHSLSGRLGFGLVLFSLSAIGDPGGVGDAETIGAMLAAGAALSAAGLLALVLTRSRLR
jgi:MFS family permease